MLVEVIVCILTVLVILQWMRQRQMEQRLGRTQAENAALQQRILSAAKLRDAEGCGSGSPISKKAEGRGHLLD